MGFSLGLIGLPNSGKTTIFNAITNLKASAEPYPFCTIEPNVAIVPVPDSRLEKLGEILRPEKLTYTTIEVVDVAGLVKDAHKGEGLGNRFLSHIREVDACAHVIRCFKGNIPHFYGSIDPERDMEIVEMEIIIADLEIVEARLKKLEKMKRAEKKEEEALRRIKEVLEKGRFPKASDFKEERKILEPFNLISLKPFFIIANIEETEIGSYPIDYIEKMGKERNMKTLYICGKLEEEISELSLEERKLYREQYRLERMAVEEIIRVGYEILDLVTFYTIVGKEVRAWTVKRGTPCQKAAGKIHSDMERGFIRAEVIGFDEFVKIGSESLAREKGLIRVEGKDYIVRDGDILHIRFAP